MQKRWIAIGAVAAVAVAVFLLVRGGGQEARGPTTSTMVQGGDVRAEARRGGAALGGIDGRVVDEAGQSVAGATVRAAPGGRGDAVTATAGADGRFTLDVEPGAWVVTAGAPGRLPAEAAVTVVAGERATVDLRLAGGGAPVRGVVRDAMGGAIAGALVVLAPEQGVLAADARRGVLAVSGDDGRFEIGVVPGRWRVTTTHPEYVGDARGLDVPAAGATIEIELVPGGVIEGVVRDRGTGAVVGGARVGYAREVVGAGPIMAGEAQQRERGAVDAGADGRFRIAGLGAGRIVLTATTDDDRASDAPTEVLLGIAETATEVEVLVAPALAIAGHVRDDDGAAVAGAEVSIEARGERRMTIAGADGAFRIGGLRAGTYLVSARSDATLPGEPVTVTLDDAPATAVVVTVRRGAFVTGRVVPAGPAEISVARPPPDGAVALRGGMFRLELGDDPVARASADGRFRIGPFDPGEVTLGGRAPDGARGEARVTVAPTGADDVVIRLEPRGRIAGRVVTRAGAPVPGAVVNLRRRGAAGGTVAIVNGVDVGAERAPVDADGRFAIAGLDAGTWELTALDERGAPLAFDRADPDAPERVELAEGQAQDDVALVVEAKDGVIRGVVIGPDGAPVPDAWVRVRPEVTRLPGVGEIGRSGRPRRGDGGGPPSWQGGGGGPPPPGDEPGEDGMMVTVAVVDGSGGLQAGEIPPVLTGEDGRFELRGLRRGRYQVSAEGLRGAARGAVDGVETGGEATVKLHALAGIAGTVTMGGAPVRAFAVSASGPTRKRQDVHDEAGAFRLSGLDPGTYQVEARTPDGGAGRATAVVEPGKPTSVTIEIAAAGTVKGRLVGADGAPLADRLVFATPRQPEGEMRIELSGDPPTTDADGRFELRSDAGARTLFAIGGKGPELRRDIEVVAGQTLDLGTITSDR